MSIQSNYLTPSFKGVYKVTMPNVKNAKDDVAKWLEEV